MSQISADDGNKKLQDEGTTWIPITTYVWDQPPFEVKLTIQKDMHGVGKLEKENITCIFGNTSLDLKVRNLDGKNYRLNLLTLH